MIGRWQPSNAARAQGPACQLERNRTFFQANVIEQNRTHKKVFANRTTMLVDYVCVHSTYIIAKNSKQHFVGNRTISYNIELHRTFSNTIEPFRSIFEFDYVRLFDNRTHKRFEFDFVGLPNSIELNRTIEFD